MTRLYFLIITMLFLTACTGGEESAFVNLPEKGWAYGDTITFGGFDGRGIYYVTVGHDSEYPYSNLWLEVTPVDSTGAAIRRDTVDMVLCDRFGRWQGHGFGGSYRLEIPVKPEQPLPRPAAEFKIRHIMRLDTLRGIDAIGARLS